MIGHPKTRAEAKAYRYNVWGGNEKGRAYDPTRCAYEVFPQERGALHHQCERKPYLGPGGLYCKTHARFVDPESVKKDAPASADRREDASGA